MDHRESTESPSHSQKKMIEKRMEMVAQLLNSRIEEEDKGQEAKKKLTQKEMNKYSGICRGNRGKWTRLAIMIHRMFL